MKLCPFWRYEDLCDKSSSLRKIMNILLQFYPISECGATSLRFRGHWFLLFITLQQQREKKNRCDESNKNSLALTYFSIFACAATTIPNMTAIHTSFFAYLGPSVIQAISFALCHTLGWLSDWLAHLKYNSFQQRASNSKNDATFSRFIHIIGRVFLCAAFLWHNFSN